MPCWLSLKSRPGGRLRTGGSALLLVLLALPGCRRSAPADVAALVNGQPIRYEELEKHYQAQFASAAERPSGDELWYRKLELLRLLIDSEIMRQRAEKLDLTAVDADVDAKVSELKAGYTEEEWQKSLQARRLSLDDLRKQLRRELSIQKLLNREITAHISITDKEVTDFYNENKASYNYPETRYHIATILVTPFPDPNVRNLKSDKAQNDEQAKRKIEMIASRIRQGEDFGMLAQSFSEDPNTAASGGDFGFIPESALERVPPETRKALMALRPGQVSDILRTQEGYRLIRLISREPAGQRELNDPRVQQEIRDTLRNRKDQLLRAGYYEVARNEAKVVNYLAQRITDTKGKMQ